MSKDDRKLPLDPYKGVRDFYPEDMAIENYILDAMKKTAESFGYHEYSASILEHAELYEAKSGEEIVREQMYRFEDRGGRQVALRPEMTPTVARMIAAKRKELQFPLRWYSLPNVFRYERPQRGRLREHWQLNVDIFGIAGIEAEIEIMSIAYEIMKRFGASDKDFEIKINDIKVVPKTIARLAEAAGKTLSTEEVRKISKLIDKRAKLMGEEFHAAMIEVVGKDVTDSIMQNFTQEKAAEILMELPERAQLSGIIDALHAGGVLNVVHDPALTRGFEYYTGIIFEVFDKAPENNRSLFGGGRYDNLLEIFDVEPIPAVGFGMGDVTMRDFLETHKLMPPLPSKTHLALCTVSPEYIPEARRLADVLRRRELNVSVNLTEKKVAAQIKLADREQIPFVICIGEEETQRKTYRLKNLRSGEEKELPEEKLIEKLSAWLHEQHA